MHKVLRIKLWKLWCMLTCVCLQIKIKKKNIFQNKPSLLPFLKWCFAQLISFALIRQDTFHSLHHLSSHHIFKVNILSIFFQYTLMLYCLEICMHKLVPVKAHMMRVTSSSPPCFSLRKTLSPPQRTVKGRWNGRGVEMLCPPSRARALQAVRRVTRLSPTPAHLCLLDGCTWTGWAATLGAYIIHQTRHTLGRF